MTHTVTGRAVDGIPCLALVSPEAETELVVAPGAGMVCCSLRHRGAELLGQRKGLLAYVESGSTMGVPLLHPWANRLDGMSYEAAGRAVRLDPSRSPLKLDGGGLPIHGTLTAAPEWAIADCEASVEAARIEASLDYGARDGLLAAFPFPHVVELDVALRGSEVTITTLISPTEDVPVPISFGWHPYFVLPDVERAAWEVELPVTSEAVLDERGIPTGETVEPAFRGGRLGALELDALYPGLTPQPVFALSGGGRRIELELGDGYPVAQVYAPNDHDTICFEPMTTWTNALVSGSPPPALAIPGKPYSATFTIRVR